MNKILAALGLIVSAGIGFFATLALLGTPADRPASGRALYSIDPKTAVFGWYPGTEVGKRDDGLQIASKFNTFSPSVDTDGMIYHSIEEKTGFKVSEQRIKVEIDATLPGNADAGQKLQIRFMQNGLKDSGWQSVAMKPGRQAYAIAYEAPKDIRASPKLDQIWLRSDAEGRGRAFVVHAISIRAE